MKARFQLRCPVWNNPLCPRLSGLLDGGLHKARVQSGPEGERLYSGRVRVQGERFKVFEAQVEQQLLAAAAPLQKEAGQLAWAAQDSAASRTDTTRSSRQAARTGAARRRLVELNCELEALIRQADCIVEEALSQANSYLSVYAKASRFAVLEQEIHRLSRSRNFREIVLIPATLVKGG